MSAVASPGAEPIENLASNKTSNVSTAKQDITQVLDVEFSTAAGNLSFLPLKVYVPCGFLLSRGSYFVE